MRAVFYLVAAPAALVLLQPLQAATYLTVAQAQQVIFPGRTFAPADLQLNDAQAREIEKRSGLKVRGRTVQIWRSADGATFLVDEVLGKHEFITYAVGLSEAGDVVGVEILDYRESYGHEIRNAAWRRQFTGKTAAAPLKVGRDIENISGATLSCKHIADGIRRLLATWDVALRS
jgi:Na+-translocating ferredoxin:NAD+ oxidoreductase RnfG subunit